MKDTAIGPVVPLNDVIALSAKEAFIYEDLSQASSDKIAELLSSKQALEEEFVISVLKISLFYEAIAAKIKKANAFWEAAWKKLGKTLHTKEYPTLPNLDAYTLYSGKFLYYEYQKLKACKALEPEPAESSRAIQKSYLWHAANVFHYYEAMDVLCWEMLCGEYKKPVKLNTAAIELAEQAAQYYLAPGYALLAKIYNSYAHQLDKKNPSVPLQYYAQSYVAIEITEKTLETSGDAIAIAYDFRPFHQAHDYIKNFDTAKRSILTNMMATLPLPKKRPKATFFVDKKTTEQLNERIVIEFIRRTKEMEELPINALSMQNT